MSRLSFTKMHGLGNDFIVVENLDGKAEFPVERIRCLSDRRTGIGFDQMLVVESSSTSAADFNYRIFNADGAEVEHCGNGARCFARYVRDRGLIERDTIRVSTMNGIIRLTLREDGYVTVAMGVPVFGPSSIPFVADAEATHYPLRVGTEHFTVGATAIGNPHVLLEVADIEHAEVERLGPLIERHDRFPRRVNVGFAQFLSSTELKLRVFERGVGETRACGSGACAAVAIAHRQGRLEREALVHLPGGTLRIAWPSDTASIEMTGPCSTVFEGQTSL